MSFSESVDNIRLHQGYLLRANCQQEDGEWRESQIDLNRIIGNEDGKMISQSSGKSTNRSLGWFVWGAENFAESADEIQLEGGSYLTANLPKRDGGFRERQGINLNERIANENGRLVFRGAFCR